MNRIFLLIVLCVLLVLSGILKGITIDSMEQIVEYSAKTDGDSELYIAKTPGKIGNCLQFTYEFKGGTWCEVSKLFDYISLAEGNQVRFWYKGSGQANTIEFFLEDTDENSHTVYFNQQSSNPNWTEKIVSLSAFNQLNLNKISKIKFAVSKQTGDAGGSGTIIIDKVDLYQSIQVSASSNVIDDFQDDSESTNLLGLNNKMWKDGSTSTITATSSNSNFCTLKYTKGTGSGLVLLLSELTGLDITSYGYLRFQIWGKTGGEKVGIGLMDNTGANRYFYINDVHPNGSITTSPVWVEIPIHSLNFPSADNMREFKIVFQDDPNDTGFGNKLGGGDAEIVIDNLMFYNADRETGTVKTIHDMDLNPVYSAWDNVCDSGSSSKLSLVNGYDNKAIEIDYNLDTGTWVTLEKYFYLNLYQHKGLKFYYQGDGDPNNLEVKLEDDDGTIYARKYFNCTDTDNQWKEMGFGFDELYFLTKGTDEDLNLKKIKKLYFAVSQYDDKVQGTLAIDEVRGETLYVHQEEAGLSGKIFNKVKVYPIRFSPDDDNYEDSVTFSFKLNKRAKVLLRIYNLKGTLIKEFFSPYEFQPNQEYSLEWKGKDSDNKIVRNGIYLFQLKAETFDGEIERINQGLAVIK